MQILLTLACLILLAASHVGAFAQPYPSKPITLIVPFAAGGPSDAIARLVGQSMSQTLQTPVVVENVGGAGGTIGAARVAHAQPDGYTILIHHVALAASPSLYKKLSYDPVKDLVPLGLVNYGPMVLVARKDYPAANIQELLSRLRGDGQKTSLANAGVGSNAHLCGLLLQQALGTKMTEVPYRGTAPAIVDLLSGQVDVLCDQTTNAVSHIKARKINTYAVTSQGRLDVLPDVPTMIESGFKNFDFVIWHALYAPKGTPESIVGELNKALRIAVADPTIQARFAEVGTQAFLGDDLTPDMHRARLEKEITRWRNAVAEAGLTPQ